jgi:hypothetical protein
MVFFQHPQVEAQREDKSKSYKETDKWKGQEMHILLSCLVILVLFFHSNKERRNQRREKADTLLHFRGYSF